MQKIVELRQQLEEVQKGEQVTYNELTGSKLLGAKRALDTT